MDKKKALQIIGEVEELVRIFTSIKRPTPKIFALRVTKKKCEALLNRTSHFTHRI
jgi:hypothetical protein